MWISMLVLIQSFAFYLPYYIWYSWENGKMKQMLANFLETPTFFNTKDGDTRTSSTTQSQLESSGDPLTSHVWLIIIK